MVRERRASARVSSRPPAAFLLCALVLVVGASALAAAVDNRTDNPADSTASRNASSAASPSARPRDAAASDQASPAMIPDEMRQQIVTLQQQISMLQTAIAARDSNYVKLSASLAATQQQLLDVQRRLDEFEQQIPSLEATRALEERLKAVEEEAKRVPELPPDVVSAGDFPGSIRIPRTNAAIKFGTRIRFAAVFTMGPLGSEDRFLTNSIPVAGTPEAGKGERTNFNAGASRFNLDLRTPTKIGEMRAFLEGDFAGDNSTFRLRHAYGQYFGLIFGQTWSTFSDPTADHQDLDFEGVSSENVIRQPQIRYSRQLRSGLRAAVAAELPEVSLTGGAGVNLFPDIVGRVVWSFGEGGHLQVAAVARQIRGEATVPVGATDDVAAGGGGLSGVLPVQWGKLTDRIIFQLNGGQGTARYINDLNSLGGQDAVFDSTTGTLQALPAVGWYIDYEHQWIGWSAGRELKLRSSFIWSYVTVDNLDIQPDDAYQHTNRFVANVIFTPNPKLDVGLEYIYGTRRNKNGASGSSDQIQLVTLFLF